MTKYEYWRQEWRSHREKAKAALDRFCAPAQGMDWSAWDEYKVWDKKGNHAFAVMRRCKWALTPGAEDA